MWLQPGEKVLGWKGMEKYIPSTSFKWQKFLKCWVWCKKWRGEVRSKWFLVSICVGEMEILTFFNAYMYIKKR